LKRFDEILRPVMVPAARVITVCVPEAGAGAAFTRMKLANN
jgi:hypothetical protein